MTRADAFESLKAHAYYGRYYRALGSEGLLECVRFIEQNDRLDHLRFESATLQWKLGDASKRGPRYPVMTDLLIAANNISFNETEKKG